MSRRHAAIKRVIVPDPRYDSLLVSRFINIIMEGGKKSVAEKIIYSALDEASKVLKQDALEILTKVLANVRPSVEVRPKRVGGATFQVPREVAYDRSVALAFKWIKSSFSTRGKGSATRNLKLELLDAYVGKGNAVKTRDNTHKMAESNRAFAHFRW